MAAVKACGEGALLAGRAAAHLFGLMRGGPPAPEVIQMGQRRPRGVRTRRSHWIAPADATRWLGIPVTTIPRTLVDLAAVLSKPELARAVHEADVRHRVNPTAVEAVLARRHNWPGARSLRRILWGELPVTLSKLESDFLDRLREAALPLPEVNRRIDGRYVDCRWPANRLTVELDGYQYHHTRHAWEQDRQREREARGRGDEFRRYTWTDVNEDPGTMLTELRALLTVGPS
ncbi:MAG: hypothetical protein WB771_02655 [Solirubrobacterales bacterium]